MNNQLTENSYLTTFDVVSYKLMYSIAVVILCLLFWNSIFKSNQNIAFKAVIVDYSL